MQMHAMQTQKGAFANTTRNHVIVKDCNAGGQSQTATKHRVQWQEIEVIVCQFTHVRWQITEVMDCNFDSCWMAIHRSDGL